MSDYTPYRVLTTLIAVVTDSDDTILSYPHGKVIQRMQGTGKVAILFNIGVIDAPTEEEIALFTIPKVSESVKPIPQDPRGFDQRLSGVARSVDSSAKGRGKGVIEKFERESYKKGKSKKVSGTKEKETEKEDDDE